MSTRANVIIKDENETFYFYRHSDGYPSGVADTLNKFVKAVNNGMLRANAGQSAGWLILLGADEYNVSMDGFGNGDTPASMMPWKVGAYEPTIDVHGDIEYLYVIALENNKATCYVMDKNFRNWENEYELYPELQDGAQYDWA